MMVVKVREALPEDYNFVVELMVKALESAWAEGAL
jgi:hypothetical protein